MEQFILRPQKCWVPPLKSFTKNKFYVLGDKRAIKAIPKAKLEDKDAFANEISILRAMVNKLLS
jgi:hypothetical protein